MRERVPLWWRLLESDELFAGVAAVGLVFLFGWPSLYWGSSLLERLPWWGPAAPVLLWLALVGVLRRKRRRSNGSAL